MSETAFCYILVDNYDDLLEQISSAARSTIMSKIVTALNDWAASLDAVILSYESDRFVMAFDKAKLPEMAEERFKILDRVREIGPTAMQEMTTPTSDLMNQAVLSLKSDNKLPLRDESAVVTLSMGIGVSEKPLTIAEADALSREALDFALARGGDQCVVRNDDSMTYYGGKAEAAERRTKVKARVRSHALRAAISGSDRVFIMGHPSPDMDCIGAAVGLMGACRILGRDCRFILSEVNAGITPLMDYLEKDERYDDAFITPKEALAQVTDNALLIIIDTQSPTYLEVPELAERISDRVLIDHHRRCGKGITGTMLSYVESYASSTCELVTELLQYMDDGNEMSKNARKLSPLGKTESNALMAGLCMDTKMFTFKTGVRTFEAAALLKRKGADTVIAKTMLQSDIHTYSARADAVRRAQIFCDTIAITAFTDDSDNAQLIGAQAADELLNIRGVTAAFTIVRNGSRILISGRSMGEINVQLILEKLGGGGHLSIAGAQLEDFYDIQKAQRMLENAIHTYMAETNIPEDSRERQ